MTIPNAHNFPAFPHDCRWVYATGTIAGGTDQMDNVFIGSFRSGLVRFPAGVTAAIAWQNAETETATPVAVVDSSNAAVTFAAITASTWMRIPDDAMVGMFLSMDVNGDVVGDKTIEFMFKTD